MENAISVLKQPKVYITIIVVVVIMFILFTVYMWGDVNFTESFKSKTVKFSTNNDLSTDKLIQDIYNEQKINTGVTVK